MSTHKDDKEHALAISKASKMLNDAISAAAARGLRVEVSISEFSLIPRKHPEPFVKVSVSRVEVTKL